MGGDHKITGMGQIMDSLIVIQSIITLFSEAYAGPADPRATWFIDNEPDSGILGIIKDVSSTEASLSSNQNNPGTTIAANVEHLRWSLANANRTLEGGEYQAKWSESWNTLAVDDSQWQQLKEQLRKEYEGLIENLNKQTKIEGDYLTGVMALIPHAAYHLGNIRQLIERARENS
jgi:hypothetical protein